MRAADPDFNERAYSYEGAEYPSDRELVHQIITDLRLQEGQDTFIFAISVQIHIPFENYADSEYYVRYIGNEYTDEGGIKRKSKAMPAICGRTDSALQTLVNICSNGIKRD